MTLPQRPELSEHGQRVIGKLTVTRAVTDQHAFDQGKREAVTAVTAVTAPVRRTSWTAAELLASEFPEPRWAVEGIVAEGVTLLAGAPKLGKSWLALGLCVAVATGDRALGKIEVEQGESLYLALEDTPRRLKSRLAKVTADVSRRGLDDLTIATECPPIPAGGDARLSEWLDKHPRARLVVIDVFAKVRGHAAPGTPMYDADYSAITRVQAIANHYGVPFLVVHHTRKLETTDFLDAVNGSQGLAGGADAVLVLKRARGRADGILHITGRDVDEAEHGLAFAKDLGSWRLLDAPVAELTMSDTRLRIFGYVKDSGKARPKEIADKLKLDHDVVRQRLSQMVKDGQLDGDGKGNYYPPVTAVTPSQPDQNRTSEADPSVTAIVTEPPCQTCGAPLWHPESRQLGVCGSCRHADVA